MFFFLSVTQNWARELKPRSPEAKCWQRPVVSLPSWRARIREGQRRQPGGPGVIMHPSCILFIYPFFKSWLRSPPLFLNVWLIQCFQERGKEKNVQIKQNIYLSSAIQKIRSIRILLSLPSSSRLRLLQSVSPSACLPSSLISHLPRHGLTTQK